MGQYYFAFKVNPIDAMRCNFPRQHSQDFGHLCATLEDAQKYLRTAAVPEHTQDWMYQRYKLPAVDMIITAAPVTTISPLPKVKEGAPVPIFAHQLKHVDITSVFIQIDADEVHGQHMMGYSQDKTLNSDNYLLSNTCGEMLARMSDIAEYHSALAAHPEVPESAMKEWATLMYSHGAHSHRMMEEYYNAFAQCYLQDVVVGEQLGPQYGVAETTTIALDAAARYVLNETMTYEYAAFESILEDVAAEALPYNKERFMQTLRPENYKAAMLEELPEHAHNAFSKLWDSTLDDLRLSSQVALRKGETRIQDITLATAIKVCTEMEYAAFRAQDGTQHFYSKLRSAAVGDEVKLEQFDNPEIDELEEEI